VQAATDRMNARIEILVEDYNEVREALVGTRAEQARTREQVLDTRRRLRAAGASSAGPRCGARPARAPTTGVLRPRLRRPLPMHHVGMYVGGGAMAEAPYSGASVRVASIGRGDDAGAVCPTG
jgi:hypothetical protein